VVNPVLKEVLDTKSVGEKFSVIVREFFFFLKGFFPVAKGDEVIDVVV